MEKARTHNRAWRSLAAALLAACLALGLAMLHPQQAQAAPDEGLTFTVRTASGEEYSVSAYPLFKAHVDYETNAASEVEWNDGYEVVVNDFIAGQEYSEFLVAKDLDNNAQGALSYISAKIEGDAELGLDTKYNGHKAVGDGSFAALLAKAIADSGITPKDAKTVSSGAGAQFTGLTSGFYLFYSEGLPPIWTSVGGKEAVANVKDTLQLAAVKQVWDGQSQGWGKIAAAGNEQQVRFRVTGEAPNSVPPAGTAFSYVLTDTLTSGLMHGEASDVKVCASDGTTETDITDYFTVAIDETSRVLTASCEDLFAEDGSQASLMRGGSVTHIVFYYDATMNENAGSGSSNYNVNTAVITYKKGNVEASTETAANATEEAAAKVTTFAIDVVKTDNSETPRRLSQTAKFTLTMAIDGNVKYMNNEGKLVDERYEWETADGEFTVSAIPAGTYTLTEIEPPADFKMPAVAATDITITPVFDQDGGALEDITVRHTNPDSVSVETDVSYGVITVSVQNEPKTVLPITGMEPSQLGTIIGALLVACGIVALLFRARRKAKV